MTVSFDLKAKLLISAGIIALLAAIWHLLCIFGGASWFTFARAPQAIIDSAHQGTLLAPIGTIIVASLMFSCSIFAFSAVGIIAKVPLLKPALMTIATLCTLRALVALPMIVTTLDVWEMVASTVWFYVGLCFIIGSIELIKCNQSA